MKNLIMLPALSLLLGQGALIGVGPSNCGANRSSNLIVGSNFVGKVGYTPFEIIDTGVLPNNVIGFDAAVACELANRLGFAGVSFLQDDFVDLLGVLSLPNSTFDIVMSAMSITPQRKIDFPNVSFVKYNEDSLGLVYIKGSNRAGFTDPKTALEELANAGTIVGGVAGSRQQIIINENNDPDEIYDGLDFFSSAILEGALDELITDDVQALFVDGATAVALAASNFNLLAVNNVVDTAQTADQTTQGLGIAIPNECCQLYVNIQKAIDDMNADGTLERLRTEFNVPQGFIPVSGLAPAGCTLSPTINSNAIANYLFTNYCPCIVTPIIPVDGAPVT